MNRKWPSVDCTVAQPHAQHPAVPETSDMIFWKRHRAKQSHYASLYVLRQYLERQIWQINAAMSSHHETNRKRSHDKVRMGSPQRQQVLSEPWILVSSTDLRIKMTTGSHVQTKYFIELQCIAVNLFTIPGVETLMTRKPCLLLWPLPNIYSQIDLSIPIPEEQGLWSDSIFDMLQLV